MDQAITLCRVACIRFARIDWVFSLRFAPTVTVSAGRPHSGSHTNLHMRFRIASLALSTA
jgi:hypothetical protein